MIANIFDLTGDERYCRAEYRDEFEIKPFVPKLLRNLLIYPRDPDSNRAPYLQDTERPELADFVIGRGECDFSSSWFLSDLLDEERLERRWVKLKDYFNGQLGLIEGFDRTADNIILVRDHYTPEYQEGLLQSCSMPRNNTLLLWRSVAVCLGAEEQLLKLGAKEGTRVAIVDCLKNGRFDIAILTMRKDGERLVPARSSFKKKQNYPLSNFFMKGYSKIPKGGRYEFWRHTWQRAGKFIVMDEDGCWCRHDFSLPELTPYFPVNVDVDMVVVAGIPYLEHHENIADGQIIYEAENEDFAMLGAGRFATRNRHGMPTYFDECEPLHFIFQDESEEQVRPRKLIDGGALCRGGKRIEGNVNTDFRLKRDNDNIRFLLHVGAIDNNTPLKELTLRFDYATIEDQPLKLYPSMIPGQGIARVEVDASPLLRNRVELDFLTMQPAFYKGKEETIASLEARMPRSFPIDVPEAEASHELYMEYSQHYVDAFLKRGHHLPGGCFAHTTWPNIGGAGIEVFKRINVFGTQKGAEYPSPRNKKMFHDVFAKIARQYEYAYAHGDAVNDYIRLAAWTYRCGREEFKTIIDHTLEKIRQKSRGRYIQMLNQEFTVCSNMLSLNEQKEYVGCFIRHSAVEVDDAKDEDRIVKNVDWWIRALMGILIYSNDALKDIPSDDCERCMAVLRDILESYVLHGKGVSYTQKVVCCMLFMLRRRKYDHDFLREDTSDLYEKLMNLRTELSLFANSNALFIEFFKEVENKGSLEGLASAASGTIMSNDDN